MTLTPPATLTTPRLLLRPPALSDAEGVFAYAHDLEVTRYLTWQPHQSIADTETFLQRCLQVWQEGSAFPWVIIRKSDHTLLGMIDATPDDFQVMLGFRLAQPYWNQGYTSEAVRVVVDWYMAQPGIYRVWAYCDTENLASARVLEKAGMQREGVLRRYERFNISPEPRDCFCYALVK